MLTLGMAALLQNGLVFWLASLLVEGFRITDCWAAYWRALLKKAINITVSSLLMIFDGYSWYPNQVKRCRKRIAKPEENQVPGSLFLEIDGLARLILEKALSEGLMPTLQYWLERDSHVLTGRETDTSSQTSASQAGVLPGDNSSIPAFRGYDKTEGQLIASINSKILPSIEKERSVGNGLLSNNGANRGNLFTGDAKYVMATTSDICDREKFHTSEFQAYFANPDNTSRTLMLFVWDILLEIRQYRSARKSDIPLGLGGTTGMLKSGWKKSKITRLWLAVCALSILAAVLGYGLAQLFQGASGALIDAFAAGSLLVMLTDSMIPESFEHGGKETGLSLVLGFGTAFAVVLFQSA